MKSCGKRFHDEVGKFRFLNELIKVVSPKVGVPDLRCHLGLPLGFLLLVLPPPRLEFWPGTNTDPFSGFPSYS